MDHGQDMAATLMDWSGTFTSLQGNFDPIYLTLPPDECIPLIQTYLKDLANVPAPLRKGWVCGLGHGVLPPTHEENVRAFVSLSRDTLGHAGKSEAA